MKLPRFGVSSTPMALTAIVAALVGGMPISDLPASGSVVHEPRTYRMERLVSPNPVMKSTGMVIYNDEDEHFLYTADVLRNTIFRVDLETFAVDRIAHDFEPATQQLISPHTLEIDGDGQLYVTEWAPQAVRRLDRDGTGPRVVVGALTGTTELDQSCDCPVATGTSGIAFSPDRERLFVGDNMHDRAFNNTHDAGSLWEVDPDGVIPAHRVASGLGLIEEITIPQPQPDQPLRAYVTDVYGPDGRSGRIHVVNVDTGEVEDELTGFDKPWGIEYDAARETLLITEMGGNLWQVDLRGHGRQLLARIDRPGMTSIALDPGDGTIYVSNGLYGGLYRLDEPRRKLVPVLPAGEFAVPTSLNEATADAALPPGTLWVGDFTAVSTLTPQGRVTRVLNFQADDYDAANPDDAQWQTASALQTDKTTVYYGESFFFRDVIGRLDLTTGRRVSVTEPNDVVGPYHIRAGPDDDLLVTEQGLSPLGRLVRVDPTTGTVQPIVDDLATPGGLRYDPATGLAYVSEVAAGRIWAIDVSTCTVPLFCQRRLVAEGLDTPEGLDLDGNGGLVVVEGAGDRRLVRIDLDTGQPAEIIATDLPTRLRGPIPKPFGFDLLADVLVRDTGEIVVTAPKDASILVFRPVGMSSPSPITETPGTAEPGRTAQCVYPLQAYGSRPCVEEMRQIAGTRERWAAIGTTSELAAPRVGHGLLD